LSDSFKLNVILQEKGELIDESSACVAIMGHLNNQVQVD